MLLRVGFYGFLNLPIFSLKFFSIPALELHDEDKRPISRKTNQVSVIRVVRVGMARHVHHSGNVMAHKVACNGRDMSAIRTSIELVGRKVVA